MRQSTFKLAIHEQSSSLNMNTLHKKRDCSDIFGRIWAHIPKLAVVILSVVLFFWCQPGYTQAGDSPKDKKPKVKVSGFLQVQFLQAIDSNGDNEVRPNRFRVQRARLKFEGKVNEHTTFDVEVDPRARKSQVLCETLISR
jgi:hypothetical protein